MLVILKSGAVGEESAAVSRVAERLGCEVHPLALSGRTALLLSGADLRGRESLFEALTGVEQAVPVARPIQRVSRVLGAPLPPLRVGGLTIGGDRPVLIAGPCAVESDEQLIPLARCLKDAGADLLRGGAFKPRTSPYDFQGLSAAGLEILARAREASGLPVVTEAVDERSLELVEEHADVIQIGARNMHNYALLKRAARCSRPILLKRGFAATLEEFLLAAEYLLDGGHEGVMLCERGIRTFATHTRFTLDLAVVPQLRKYTQLPVLVDPSHAAGVRDCVAPLARAAVVVGADGVMVEVHPDPARALSDGAQSLDPTEFAALAADLRRLAATAVAQRESVT